MRLDDSLLQKHLGHPLFSLLTETADELGMPCYVIGGYVRDIFLQRASKDIDVVTVGSGIELARAFAAKLGKRAFLSVFSNFGTAQVKYKSHEIEFVGARRESYSHDSRKPIVEDGTLTDDQNRRDFTINALAICLNKECFGELVDPFGGIADLDAGNVVDKTLDGVETGKPLPKCRTCQVPVLESGDVSIGLIALVGLVRAYLVDGLVVAQHTERWQYLLVAGALESPLRLALVFQFSELLGE